MIRTKPLARVLRATALCTLLLLAPRAAIAAEATATASAAILQPVTVTKVADLDFGKIVAGPSASTVTLSSNGQFQCGAGLTCLDNHNIARFTVSGVPGQMVSIQSDSQITLSSSGGAKMPVVLDVSAKTLKLNNGQNNTIGVGGTLSVAAYQAEGVYTGLFTITVNYN
jgi:Mat/Ecp fimbriae major subunit